MTVPSDSTTGSSGNWLFKNKEHGKTSAAASLVWLFLLGEFLFCVQIMEVEILTRSCCFPIVGYDSIVGCGLGTCPTRQIFP